jgi:ubiquitin carboxyl-terminal hydrolase 14
MVLVKVKHGKTSHEVELDQTKTVKDFKSALQAITNVPPERQTLMGKGVWIGTLKDDNDLSNLKVKPGQLITLMGSADVLKEVPKNVRDRCLHVPHASYFSSLSFLTHKILLPVAQHCIVVVLYMPS